MTRVAEFEMDRAQLTIGCVHLHRLRLSQINFPSEKPCMQWLKTHYFGECNGVQEPGWL